MTRVDPQGSQWLRYVAASGGPGRAWAGRYGRHRRVELLSNEALDQLRRRRPERASPLLRRAERERLQLGGDVELSIRCVLDRWLHGVRAYAEFLDGDLDTAASSLELARAAVAAAVSDAECLLPLAHHCHEFTLHRARIERNRQCWGEMRRLIDEARAMVLGEAPLCRLEDGREIHLLQLRQYFSRLDLHGEELQALAPFFDDDLQRRLFERFVRQMLPAA